MSKDTCLVLFAWLTSFTFIWQDESMWWVSFLCGWFVIQTLHTSPEGVNLVLEREIEREREREMRWGQRTHIECMEKGRKIFSGIFPLSLIKDSVKKLTSLLLFMPIIDASRQDFLFSFFLFTRKLH